jgi:predicted nucleotidyltransferase
MIKLPQKEIAAFCRNHHIAKLSVFGSALTEDFGPASDVDFLVEFEPGHVPGLIRFAGMARELSEIIGRKADLRTADDLSRYFRDKVIAAAVVQYAR